MSKKKSHSRKKSKQQPLVEFTSKVTRWVGSPESLVTHTLIFIGASLLPFFGVDFNTVLLVVTTIVSLEAIYLAIFIQMSVNKNTEQLMEVEKDIEEISEDIEEIQEEDEEDEREEEEERKNHDRALARIDEALETVLKEIDEMKKK